MLALCFSVGLLWGATEANASVLETDQNMEAQELLDSSFVEIPSVDSYIEDGDRIYVMADGTELIFHDIEIPVDGAEVSLFEEKSSKLSRSGWTTVTIPKTQYVSTTINSYLYSPPKSSVAVSKD